MLKPRLLSDVPLEKKNVSVFSILFSDNSSDFQIQAVLGPIEPDRFSGGVHSAVM